MMWCGFVFAREELVVWFVMCTTFAYRTNFFTGRFSLHSYFTHPGFILCLASAVRGWTEWTWRVRPGRAGFLKGRRW
jgi:hypothetical protein